VRLIRGENICRDRECHPLAELREPHERIRGELRLDQFWPKVVMVEDHGPIRQSEERPGAEQEIRWVVQMQDRAPPNQPAERGAMQRGPGHRVLEQHREHPRAS
jgi:hypothetical protein